MNKHLLFLPLGLVLSACTATPYNNVEYRSQRSPGQIAADRENVENMASRDRANRREEMMDEAEATEIATRNNPTSVTTNQTNILWW